MTFVEDFIRVNRQVAEKSIKSSIKHWPIIFTGLIYSLIGLVGHGLIGLLLPGPLGILRGIIDGFLAAAIISNYLYLLYNISYYDRLNFKIFKAGFKAFFLKVYSILVISWLLSHLKHEIGFGYIRYEWLVSLLIYILLNALPETIYQKRYDHPLDNISYSFEFIKDNHLYWFIPVGIFSLLLYMVAAGHRWDIFAVKAPILLSRNLLINWILGQAIFSFMMIYRANLYKILSTSSKRKREFMRKF